jgi:acetylornithine deacetylase/succinyl-diaminopimelate desuccinylase-like protein
LQVGAPNALRFKDKESILSHRWRFPNLSIHGIEGAWAGDGAKTVIPQKVKGKFSIRIVPDMEVDDVAGKVTAHVNKVFESLGSPNVMKVELLSGAKAWLSDYTDANYSAAKRAIETVFKTSPDYTREGGSIPVTLWLQEATHKSVMLLPIGGSDDGAHSQNEKLNVTNYINGIKVLGSYLEEIAKAGKV